MSVFIERLLCPRRWTPWGERRREKDLEALADLEAFLRDSEEIDAETFDITNREILNIMERWHLC